MPVIDATSYEELRDAVRERSSDQLVQDIAAQPGGVDQVLDDVFAGMAASFNPEKAAGEQATIQYDVAAPDGVRSYQVEVADGACTASRGGAASPRVSIRMGLADFLRVVTRQANPLQLFMTGKVNVNGELFFAQTMERWFDRPG